MKRTVSFACFICLACSIGSAATFTLIVNTNGNGTVVRNPTNSVYPGGSVVTLTAQPGTNWLFSSWSGDVTSTNNPLNVTMDTNKVITASFSPISSYTLTVNTSGNGSIAPSGGTFLSNTVVSLTATPSNGWAFHHWSGDASGNVNPINVTMNTNKSIAALFVQPLSIVSQPSGGSANIGSSFSLSVVATGSPPINYEWFFNNVALSNATRATLALTNIGPGNGGPYQVVVSNPYGSVTSAVAVLAVNCPGTNVVSVASDAALRAAIAIGGHVRLCFSGTLTLTNTIDVTKDASLDASGASVVIDGNGAVRLFTVRSSVVLALTNLMLINGNYTETNTSQATAGGAAILSLGGIVGLVGCVLSNNAARDSYGGSIACLGGSLMITNSLFVSNIVRGSIAAAQKNVGGGAIYLTNASVNVKNCSFVGNTTFADSTTSFPGFESTASLFGGAIFMNSGTGTLAEVKFNGNTAVGGYTRNGTSGESQGGCLYNSGTLQIRNCSFATNLAVGSGGLQPAFAKGGAICNVGALQMFGSAIHDNVVQGGVGRDMISGGSAAFAGGIFNSGGIALTNSTISGNASRGGDSRSAGSLGGNAYGGAIFNTNGSVTMVNVTVASNEVRGGVWFGTNNMGTAFGANVANTNGTCILRNSLVAYQGTSVNVWGVITDGGYNICSDGSANFSSGSSFNFTDPKLRPLADNGGPTLTMALAAGSPAIDWAPAAGAPTTDQRGFPRPYGTGVDLGAVELGPLMPSLSARQSGNNVNLSFIGQASVSYRIQRSPDLLFWETEENTGPLSTNGVVSRSYPAMQPRRFYRLTQDF